MKMYLPLKYKFFLITFCIISLFTAIYGLAPYSHLSSLESDAFHRMLQSSKISYLDVFRKKNPLEKVESFKNLWRDIHHSASTHDLAEHLPQFYRMLFKSFNDEQKANFNTLLLKSLVSHKKELEPHSDEESFFDASTVCLDFSPKLAVEVDFKSIPWEEASPGKLLVQGNVLMGDLFSLWGKDFDSVVAVHEDLMPLWETSNRYLKGDPSKYVPSKDIHFPIHFIQKGEKVENEMPFPLVDRQFPMLNQLAVSLSNETNKSLILSGIQGQWLDDSRFNDFINLLKTDNPDLKIILLLEDFNFKNKIDASIDLCLFSGSHITDLLLPSELGGDTTDLGAITRGLEKLVKENGIPLLLVNLQNYGIVAADADSVRIVVGMDELPPLERDSGEVMAALYSQMNSFPNEKAEEALLCAAAQAEYMRHGGKVIPEEKAIARSLTKLDILDISLPEIGEVDSNPYSWIREGKRYDWSCKTIKAIRENKQPIWVTDMDETLTPIPAVPMLPDMAREVARYLIDGGIMMLATGSTFGDISLWGTEHEPKHNIRDQFLFPLYEQMKDMGLSPSHIHSLLQQVVISSDNGGNIMVVEEVSDHVLKTNSLFSVPSFMDHEGIGEEKFKEVEKGIQNILGFDFETSTFLTTHHLAEELISNQYFDLKGEYQISWELDLLETLLTYDEESFFFNEKEKKEWWSFVKTIRMKNQGEELFYQIYKNDSVINSVSEMSRENVILMIKKLKGLNGQEIGLIQKVHEVFGSDFLKNREFQLQAVLLGIGNPTPQLKKVYKNLNSKFDHHSTNINIRNRFCILFEKLLSKIPGLEKNTLEAQIAGSTSVDIHYPWINKGSAIRALDTIKKILNDDTIEDEVDLSFFNIPGILEWRNKLSANQFAKWTNPNRMTVMSGDSFANLRGNDVSAVEEADIVINADSQTPFGTDVLEAFKDNRVFLETSQAQKNLYINFLRYQMPLLSFLHSDSLKSSLSQNDLDQLFKRAA